MSFQQYHAALSSPEKDVSRQVARYRRAHTYEITQIAFSHHDAHVISADSLHIKEWSIRGGGEQESVTMASPATGQVKVTTDGLHAVAVLENGQLGVWNLRSGELESTLPHPSGPSFDDTDIGPAERITLASQRPEVLAWNKKLMCVWNLTTGACVGTWKAGEDGEQPWAVEIRDAAITGDGAGVVYLDGVDISFWSPGEGASWEHTTMIRLGMSQSHLMESSPYHLAVTDRSICGACPLPIRTLSESERSSENWISAGENWVND